MIIGLDMGGTHTDAVAIEGKNIIASSKILTKTDILSSILEAITKLFEQAEKNKIKRIVLSTTLTTNAIVQNKLPEVAMVIEPGPGIPKEYLKAGDNTFFVEGYIDHRGKVIKTIDHNELSSVKEKIKKSKIKYAGAVSKFSTRNPSHEKLISEELKDITDCCFTGSTASGILNFPRRINTCFLNASVFALHEKFVKSVLAAFKEHGINAPVYMLKADGGTIKIEESLLYPAQTITSGPAASIMGVLALSKHKDKTSVALDIGGTTTDIAIIYKGAPLLEDKGATIGNYKTLIRSLYTRSIGAGGDSVVKYKDAGFIIGPERTDVAYSKGGKEITPTDAVRFLNISDYGDYELSKKAMDVASKMSGLSPKESAEKIIEAFTDKIVHTVNEMLKDLNSKPVYTIHEIIEGKDIIPESLCVVGGPAWVFGKPLADKLSLKLELFQHSHIANAIGAGVSKTTTEVSIFADTSEGYVKCVEEESRKQVDRQFNLTHAKEYAKEMLLKRASRLGAFGDDITPEITEAQSFNMVRGFYTSGKNIRVVAQIKPGIIKEFL
jgi:N-methylhydantoinase A/oxoprolinase/acetone carboxylase beta subunit